MDKQRDETPIQRSVAGLLHNLVLANLRFTMVASRQRGVGMRELLALGYLRDEGDITPGDLRDSLGITTASVTALLDRLERVGYVHRERHPHDRRSVLVKLDAAGRKEVGSLFDLLTSDVADALAGMALTEQQAVGRFLVAITACFERRAREV
jgi:DNA-binding MarR family transcriptional regulator